MASFRYFFIFNLLGIWKKKKNDITEFSFDGSVSSASFEDSIPWCRMTGFILADYLGFYLETELKYFPLVLEQHFWKNQH